MTMRALKYPKIGHNLDTLWTYFGYNLDTFYIYFGQIVDTSWTHACRLQGILVIFKNAAGLVVY